MQSYIKIYMKAYGYDESSWIPCEVCPDESVEAQDIHHLQCKGMGGSKLKDYPENLIALCRADHIKYGDKTKYKDFLKEIHSKKPIVNIKTAPND